MEQREEYVRDQIGRAYGILSQTRLLSSREALDLLSSLRLGVELGIVKSLPMAMINELMILTQPGHLQKMEMKALSPEERDLTRARVIREKIRNAVIIEKQ